MDRVGVLPRRYTFRLGTVTPHDEKVQPSSPERVGIDLVLMNVTSAISL